MKILGGDEIWFVLINHASCLFKVYYFVVKKITPPNTIARTIFVIKL